MSTSVLFATERLHKGSLPDAQAKQTVISIFSGTGTSEEDEGKV